HVDRDVLAGTEHRRTWLYIRRSAQSDPGAESSSVLEHRGLAGGGICPGSWPSTASDPGFVQRISLVPGIADLDEGAPRQGHGVYRRGHFGVYRALYAHRVHSRPLPGGAYCWGGHAVTGSPGLLAPAAGPGDADHSP